MDTNEIWQLSEHVRFRRMFDEAVLIHQEQAEALVLNDTGISFLELCDGRRSAGEIISELTVQFDVNVRTLAKDLEPFLEELAEESVVFELPCQ